MNSESFGPNKNNTSLSSDTKIDLSPKKRCTSKFEKERGAWPGARVGNPALAEAPILHIK